MAKNHIGGCNRVLTFIKDFFINKQTFTSAMGDLMGVGVIIAATPGIQESLLAISPYAAMVAAAIAYAGGAISGRKTGR